MTLGYSARGGRPALGQAARRVRHPRPGEARVRRHDPLRRRHHRARARYPPTLRVRRHAARSSTRRAAAPRTMRASRAATSSAEHESALTMPQLWLYCTGSSSAFLAPSFLKDEAEIERWRRDGASRDRARASSSAPTRTGRSRRRRSSARPARRKATIAAPAARLRDQRQSGHATIRLKLEHLQARTRPSRGRGASSSHSGVAVPLSYRAAPPFSSVRAATRRVRGARVRIAARPARRTARAPSTHAKGDSLHDDRAEAQHRLLFGGAELRPDADLVEPGLRLVGERNVDRELRPVDLRRRSA